jgi:hypothetical protein
LVVGQSHATISFLMLRVQVPRRATVAESSQLIEACTKAERERGAVELDCSEVEMFGPFGVATLAASIAVRRSQRAETHLLPPKKREIARFFEEVALERLARGEQTGVGTLEVRQMLSLDALYTDHVVQILTRGVPGVSDENSYVIQLCLNELLQNVFEWSDSPVGCMVHTHWYRKTRSVRLAVVDRGIGIPASLRRRQVQSLHRASDGDVIVAAVTTSQLTARANQVGGLGLKTIRGEVCDRGGRLTVLSLGSKVVWTGAKHRQARSEPFRGTAIEIDFRPFAPYKDTGSYIPVF